MDQSPRKRVTRSRVAARAAAAAESNSKSNSKVITTTSKAGPTTTNTMSSSSSLSLSKRNIQNDEVHLKEADRKEGDRKNSEPEDKTVLPKFKTTRSRTRAGLKPESQIKSKPEPEPVAMGNLATKKPTRGRPRKAPPTENLLPRTLRGRGTRVTNIEEKQKTSSFEEKVPKRRRKQDTTITTITAITKPSGSKRCVKFEGPGKENINPSTKNPKKDIVMNEETHGTGFRAKPLRKPVSTTRAIRGRSKPIQQEGLIKSSICLAAKKLEHIDDTSSKSLAIEHSDDELAMEINKTIPYSPLKACPLRPTTNVFNASEDSDTHSSTSMKILEPKNTKAHDEMKGVITSPARRPPQTPLKQDPGANTQSLGIASSVLRSSKPTKMFIPIIKSEIPSNSSTTSLLQSPARRLPQYQDKSVSGDEHKLNSLPVTTDEYESKNDKSQATCCAVTPKSVQTNKHRETRSEVKSLDIQPELVSQFEISNDSNHKLDELFIPQPTSIFSGRMSCIVPRDIDPSFAAESVTQETKSIIESPPQEFPKKTQILENLKNSTNDEEDNNTPPSFLPDENNYNSFMLRRDIDPISEDSDSEDELSSVPTFSRDVFVAPSPYPRFGGITPRSNFTGQLKQNEGIGFTPLAQKFSHWMTTSPEKKPHAKVEFSETLTTIWDSEPKLVEDRVGYQDDMAPSSQIISDVEVKFSNQKTAQPTPTPMEIDSVQDEKQIELEKTEIDDEDLELALEANEMSLLEPSQINIPDDIMFFSKQSPQETVDHHIMTGPQIEDRCVLERERNSIPEINENNPFDVNNNVKSQNLSDMAIDPRLLALSPQTANLSIMTPKRTYTERVYHTVCKVPLKPAASETPERPMITRSASASRMASCSNTLHYQTEKVSNSSGEKLIQESVLMTPNKQAIDWSSLGTPARTPRPDLDKSLLKGAVVYVDVYTTEGADASVIFIELLTQMGARCIKSWSWNGNTEENKIGITHVIYKDGGKRTLEKVRESDGVVLCVGVAWVLDCERENKWLDETPYLVDTDVFPRGGGRRRKSMEPRALANMNGTLIPCPNTARASQRRCFSGGDSSPTMDGGEETPMTSKSHRRDSVQWLRSILPEGETSSTEDKKKNEQSKFISFLPPLTPSNVVNEKTIYDQNFSDNKYTSCFDDSRALREEYGGTPINHEEDEDEEPYFLHKENLQQKTAPVKRRFYDAELQQDIGVRNSTTYSSNNDNNNSFGGVYHNNSSSSTTVPTPNKNSTGTAPESYNYGIMMRLKAARRKSLQWAPKIGSPLARAF